MNVIVVFYSGKGSNSFLAKKAAAELDCETAELFPRAAGLVVPATATKLSFGNKPLKLDFSSYDRVILCGPLYMGSLAAPCNDFIRKYGNEIKTLDFITCCGSTDGKKDDTFGYGKVFDKLKTSLERNAGIFEAFPIELALPEDKRDDDQAMMNTRLNDANFTGEIKERLERFTGSVG